MSSATHIPKGADMRGEKHSGRAREQALVARRHSGASRGGHHEISKEECHELLERLRAQAICLEQILEDIRCQIDALECEETLERIDEELLEAGD